MVLSVALVAVAGVSEAANEVPGPPDSEKPSNEGLLADDSHGAGNDRTTPSSNQVQEQSASETQYSNEDEDSRYPEPPRDEESRRLERDTSATVYYEFYSRWLAQKGDERRVLQVKDTPSEGSTPGVRAPAAALSDLEPTTPYSQVVDNASPRRFHSTRDWKKTSRRATYYGADYESTKPARDASPARFKVRIPTAGHYTVYARWPAARDNNPATRFRINTASGLKKAEVNQRRDGGMWVRLGAYEMKAGDRYSVQVSGRSKARGRIVVDAVKVVGGTQAPPQEHVAREPAGDEAATGGNVRGAEVVERARTHIGTPYRHSPPLPCDAYRSEDCSCFTRLVYSKWLALLDDPVQQWQAGRSIEKSGLLPGDLVFFKEAGESNPITHVGIYSGNGNIIHSSSYWGKVVERPMSSVSGYYGAKRLN